MAHPVQSIDDVIHQRVRLGILAVLTECRRADFSYLREALELSDGNLFKHLKVLEAAGHLQLDQVTDQGRQRTWISVTDCGRAALAREVATLRALLDRLTDAGHP